MSRSNLFTVALLGAFAAGGIQRVAAQSCSVSASAAAFGQYDPQAVASTDTTATVTVACQGLVVLLLPYTLTLSAGSSGTVAMRSLNSGAYGLSYQVFSNVARTTVWGDGTGGTNGVTGSILIGVLTVTQTLTAYARIAANQRVGPGSYQDILILTVTY
jgi:spore coat protein U-like protein